MRTRLIRLGVSGCALVFVAAFAGKAEFAFAQGMRAALPANATAKTYDSGLECEGGYRKFGGACNAIALPSNAYLSERSYGNDWDCNKPYRRRMQAYTSGDRND